MGLTAAGLLVALLLLVRSQMPLIWKIVCSVVASVLAGLSAYFGVRFSRYSYSDFRYRVVCRTMEEDLLEETAQLDEDKDIRAMATERVKKPMSSGEDCPSGQGYRRSEDGNSAAGEPKPAGGDGASGFKLRNPENRRGVGNGGGAFGKAAARIEGSRYFIGWCITPSSKIRKGWRVSGEFRKRAQAERARGENSRGTALPGVLSQRDLFLPRNAEGIDLRSWMRRFHST